MSESKNILLNRKSLYKERNFSSKMGPRRTLIK
jgi:hypothetical protein